jgi:hypothetical protein
MSVHHNEQRKDSNHRLRPHWSAKGESRWCVSRCSANCLGSLRGVDIELGQLLRHCARSPSRRLALAGIVTPGRLFPSAGADSLRRGHGSKDRLPLDHRAGRGQAA